MKIWIFNNYNMLPSQGGLNRHYFFAQQLQKMGHEPVVFVGSHPHNTQFQMITGKEYFREEPSEKFPWVYVKTVNYEGSKLKQVFSMFQYYRNAKKAAFAMAKRYGAPDAILGSSAHPLAAVLAIRLGKRFKCKAVVEVRDLWPEAIVVYGIAGTKNPVVVALRKLEKWIYKKADAVIFTCEGGYDYIKEQQWEREIPQSKIHYINNGVDLEAFEYNREHFPIEDPDLDNPERFNVVYTGSIRRVNNLGLLLNVAKQVTDPKVRFLIWGDGDERPMLQQRVQDEGISNVVFKGQVEKKYIPDIVSRANLNFARNTPSPMFRFGISFNKVFDYLAAGKPVLCDFPCRYNPVIQHHAGIDVDHPTPASVASAIMEIANMELVHYQRYCDAARLAAQEYDFKNLSQKLVCILESV